jgi:tryptophan-rich sensory protein
MRNLISFAVFFLAVFIVAASGALFRPGSWYLGLRKPAWNPPAWIFAPVWTVLYGMIAVAGWRIWLVHTEKAVGLALAVYALQLLLNGLWSWLFFGLHKPAWALAEIVALLVSIITTIVTFERVDSIAAWLLVPYLVWVGFATVLNFELWRLNRRANAVEN